ncbi:3321_t:CDS:1 [Funneliformis geosporum]|uniref:20050_t:CDS:1 n=1 Tax=Funneliformis geosporum TaxID=1117311 RepID=A0A9W4SC83_9GLOM|nr:20050_t:CDS:1 [Funneliformis geosporum]CAI2162017.1 3321_t:CDS:1 [Funneliformis geosporum]
MNSENLLDIFRPSIYPSSNVVSLSTLPRVILPFPPNITAYEIAHKRRRSKICSKTPNAFFIYRKAFVDHLSLLDHRLKMTEVSRLVSDHWKNESQEVKATYEKISKQVEKELNDMRNRDLVYVEHKVVKRRRQRTLYKNSFSTNEAVSVELPRNVTGENPNIYHFKDDLNCEECLNLNLISLCSSKTNQRMNDSPLDAHPKTSSQSISNNSHISYFNDYFTNQFQQDIYGPSSEFNNDSSNKETNEGFRFEEDKLEWYLGYYEDFKH